MDKLNLEDIIKEYEECGNLHKVAKKFHTSHIRLSNILKENNYKIQNIGKRRDLSDLELKSAIDDYVINHMTMEQISSKYQVRIKKLRKIFKDNGVVINKWNGHVKKEKPIKKIKEKDVNLDKPTKECPYCGWKTFDVENKSNAYRKHIINCHGIDVYEHLGKYPEDEFYFRTLLYKLDMVTCKICGQKHKLIDDRHLQKHGITKQEYVEMFGDEDIISKSTKEKLQQCMNKMMENEEWERNSSNYEMEIKKLLEENNVEFIQHDRKILNGLELDFLIGNVGIEFNGNKYHTEWFANKKRNYHVLKTNMCNEKGIKLLQIFEDEFVFSKHIVMNKIKHILGLNTSSKKIMGRKCKISLIDMELAKVFLNDFHIQGFSSSTVYLGAFNENELIGVMSFKLYDKLKNNWELTRFATNINYICQGIGGKLFNWFVKNYKPNEIKSFADRRWTIDKDNNLYTKLGFELDSILKPDYKYYNNKVNKYKRFHKFNFRKNILHKKYNLPMSLTETEMVKELGYDRIWDCGLFKYVWKK